MYDLYVWQEWYISKREQSRRGGVIVSAFTSSVVDWVDRRFEPRSGQTKDYEIGFYCFSAKNAAFRLRAKTVRLGIRKTCQSGASCLPADCYSMSLHYNNPTKSVGLLQSGHHHFIKCNLFSPWYSWQIAHLALKNNHSLTLKKLFSLIFFRYHFQLPMFPSLGLNIMFIRNRQKLSENSQKVSIF
jgi:hypothetical protein